MTQASYILQSEIYREVRMSTKAFEGTRNSAIAEGRLNALMSVPESKSYIHDLLKKMSWWFE